MTDAELYACFGHEYTGEGYPKLDIPSDPPKTEKQYFIRHCQLNCVTDKATVEKLWKEHVAAKEAARKAEIEARKKPKPK